MDQTNLGQRMKERRRQMGISQGELARNLQVTPQHISAVEMGKRLPSLAFVAILSQQLGVSTDYLITGKEFSTPDAVSVISADNTLPVEVRKCLVSIIKALREKHEA